MLAILGWLIYRRRKKAMNLQKETLIPSQQEPSISTGYYQHGNSTRAVSKSPLQEAPSDPPRSQPVELEGR